MIHVVYGWVIVVVHHDDRGRALTQGIDAAQKLGVRDGKYCGPSSHPASTCRPRPGHVCGYDNDARIVHVR